MNDFDEQELYDDKGRLFGYSECIDMLKRHQKRYKCRIDYLEKENTRLRDKHFKDKHIQEVTEENKRICEDARRGFPITGEEENEIREWQERHLKEKHPDAVDNPNYFGPVGGNWTYIFTPTSLGTIGKIRCYCGEEHGFLGW